MKLKHIILISLLVFSYFGFTQSKNGQIPRSALPIPVRDAFNVKFPDNPKTIWKNEKANEYVAELTIDGVTHWLTFEPLGNLISTKSGIIEAELPSNVLAALNAAFEGYKLTELKKVEHSQYGLSFETLVKKNEETYLVLMDAHGTLISKEDKRK